MGFLEKNKYAVAGAIGVAALALYLWKTGSVTVTKTPSTIESEKLPASTWNGHSVSSSIAANPSLVSAVTATTISKPSMVPTVNRQSDVISVATRDTSIKTTNPNASAADMVSTSSLNKGSLNVG